MTKIEWTEETWNPVVGCSIISPGCTHCYAMGMAWRQEHAFKKLAQEHHPDKGGSAEKMAEINAAMEDARKELAA